MPSSHPTAAAAERKRLRDRVAQQNLRNKRNRRIQTLEQQVKLCQETHNPQRTDGHLETIRKLREENQVLRDQQKRLQGLLSSCQEILGSSTSQHGNEPSIEFPETHRTPSPQPNNSYQDAEPATLSNSPDSVNHCHSDSHASPIQIPSPFSQPVLCAEAEGSDAIDVRPSPRSTDINTEIESTLPTTASAPDVDMDEVEDVSGALLGFGTEISLPSQYSGSDSSSESEERRHRGDFVDLRRSMQEISQTQPGLSRLNFPYDFKEGMPFLDSGLLAALDLWAEQSIEGLPRWARTPLRTSTVDDACHSPWDADIRAIIEAPDTPSPLDLLFGSSQNRLAGSVHRCVKIWYHGNAERLAIGWLVYHYVKWRTQPSMERFSRLPNWIKPELEQTSSRHPGCLDLVLMKGLRLNIVKNHRQYDINRFIRLYCTSLRLRWSSDDEVLVPNETNDYAVRPDFFRRFMSEDGWGLKSEFISQYPELFEGLDAEKMSFSST